MASIEVTVEPDLTAAAAFALAVITIDLLAIRHKRSTISRWCRHQLHHRPVLTLSAAVLLGLHLAGEWPQLDPLYKLAKFIDKGEA